MTKQSDTLKDPPAALKPAAPEAERVPPTAIELAMEKMLASFEARITAMQTAAMQSALLGGAVPMPAAKVPHRTSPLDPILPRVKGHFES